MAKLYHELVAASLENLASDPTGVAGRLYFDTVGLFPKIHTGAAWKTLVTTDGAQALTNKDIDGGTASNTSRITVPSDTLANIISLTRKAGTVLFATDTNLFYLDDGASLSAVSSATEVGRVPLGGLMPIASNIAGAYTIPATGTVSAEGWQYCDGAAIPGGNSLSGNTPNLTDSRFIMGSSTAGTTGGDASVTLVSNNLPTHTHSISATTVPSSTHTHGSTNMYAQATISATEVIINYVNPVTSWNRNYRYTGGAGSASTGAVTEGVNIAGSTDAPSVTTTTASVTGNNTTTGSSFSILPTYLTAKYLIRVN